MQSITPNIWFNRNADEAVDFYLSVFPDSRRISTVDYPTEGLADFQKEFAGQTLTIEFELLGQRFIAINAGDEFRPNAAVSFLIACHNQAEIDHYWERLTAAGGEEQPCGWLTDKYGVVWQVAPEDFDTSYAGNPRAFAKLMTMKKIILAEFEDLEHG